MGQTLTHGIYLPDEGERNCYNGLAGNWSILDGAVGTIAEHTTALAGKAPAVHTHTKSDVTDLLNSNFIPSANNAYDLGSASNQWNNLYAKNYYYNGTQWGPDQANVWTGRQTYGAYLKSFGETRTDEWSTNSRTNAYLLSRRDTDDVSGFLINTFRSNMEQGTATHFYGLDILENSTRYSGFRFTMSWDPTLNSGSGAYCAKLGTNIQGTNPCNDLCITQLKSLNGINPGALSLPSTTGLINIASSITALDGTTQNKFTPQINGWLLINGTGPANDGFIYVVQGCIGMMSANNTTMLRCAVLIPVVAGVEVSVTCKLTTLTWANIIPCQGNV